MSTIEDDPGTYLAHRIASERASRNWSLAHLAERCDVSRAMLSKIERQEASPTATVLARIASAFDLTLAGLLTPPTQDSSRLLRVQHQGTWIDPGTGYRRRQVYLSSHLPLELVEVMLPAKSAAAMPAASYALIRQVVWVIEGRLTIVEGAASSTLDTGDRLEFGPPSDCVFRNDDAAPCRYLVAVIRR